MSRIALDLGGSGTRAKYLGRDGETVLDKIDSRFVKIPQNSRLVSDIEDRFSDFSITESTISEAVGRYARGEASRYFDGVQSVVDNSELKVNQVATYINCLHAIAKYVYKTSGANTLVKLGKIGIVIPVKEYYSESSSIPKTKLAGLHTVLFPLLGKSVSFYIAEENVKVAGEGAVVAFRLRRNPLYKDLITAGNGIVIDVGYRSSDIVIFKQFKADAKSCVSKTRGGINMESRLASALDDINKGVSNSELKTVFASGCVGKFPIHEIVRECKEVFGGVLRQDINAVATVAETSLKSLDYVIPVGRPFSDDGDYRTGKLKLEIIKGMRDDVVIVDCGDLETANVDALYELLG